MIFLFPFGMFAGDIPEPLINGEQTEIQGEQINDDNSAPAEARRVKDGDAYCNLYYYMAAMIILILLLILFCIFKAKGVDRKMRISIIIMSSLVIILLVA